MGTSPPGGTHRPTNVCAATLVGSLVALAVAVGLLGAAPSASGGPATVTTTVSYGPPLTGTPDVARPFERPAQAWSAGHRGVDLHTVAGASALAPADGVVTFAGSVAGRGVVTLAHPDGRRSSLEPVGPSVAVGTPVSRGQVVGVVQGVGSHCAPAVCLHWGVRAGTRYEDPWPLLPGAGPVVLLSWGVPDEVSISGRREVSTADGAGFRQRTARGFDQRTVRRGRRP